MKSTLVITYPVGVTKVNYTLQLIYKSFPYIYLYLWSKHLSSVNLADCHEICLVWLFFKPNSMLQFILSSTQQNYSKFKNTSFSTINNDLRISQNIVKRTLHTWILAYWILRRFSLPGVLISFRRYWRIDCSRADFLSYSQAGL